MADEHSKAFRARLDRLARIAEVAYGRIREDVEQAEKHYATADMTLKHITRLVRESKAALARRALLADRITSAVMKINDLTAELETAGQARPVALNEVPQLNVTPEDIQKASQTILAGALDRLAAKEPGVYFLVNDGQIVYVGQSIDVGGRVRTHVADPAKQFTHAAWIPCEPARLDAVERFWINALRPAYNRAGMPKGQLHLVA
jgi:hypothetical protein